MLGNKGFTTSAKMLFPIIALLLAALAGPGATALALPSEAPPWLAAVEGLREKVDSFEIFKEETRGKHALLAAEVERLTKQNEEQQEQIDQCKRSPPSPPAPSSSAREPSPSETGESRRGLQSRGEAVTMYKVSLSALALRHGSTGGDGTGHRRRIQADCNPKTLTQKTEAVFEECCNEPGEDCSGGTPHSANAGCCAVLVPFFQDCAGEMGADAESIREAVALCPTGPVAPTPTATAVLLFSAKCPPGVVLDSCIPNCDESTNGDVLLLNQDGSDMWLLCEMQNFLFSWIGAAALGGFFGENVLAFVPAVISGAAGIYAITLLADADNDVDLTVHPGQVVHIRVGVARALRWGAGGFELDGGAALTLEGLEISGPVVAAPGASLELRHVTFAPGGCVRGEATLVDTPTPELCLLNVVFDGADTDAFVASLGPGLPGTYVLRLAGEAQTFEV
jgi:hypothetical protein